jgi:hypothetical protein
VEPYACNQQIPGIDVVEHEGPMICNKCGEEDMFLIGIKDTGTGLDGNYCVLCFTEIRPEFAEAVGNIAAMVLRLLQEEEKYMSLDEWHELYGEEPEESEE